MESALRKTLPKTFSPRPASVNIAAASLALAFTAAMSPAYGAELPFQSRLTLECSNNSCTGGTSSPPAGQRITVRFISCVLGAPTDAAYSFGDLSSVKPDDQLNPLFQQFLVPQHRNGNGSWFISQETEVVISPNQQGRIRLAIEGGNPTAAVCSLAGVIRTRT
jgi:hypothetical protein